MSDPVIFTESLLKQKKKSKTKLILTVTKNVIRKNPWLFLYNTFLAVITAVINFNIALNFKEFFSSRGTDISIFEQKYSIIFCFFGRWEKQGIDFWTTFLWWSVLVLIGKGLFSLIHFYWMNYSYDKVENDLKKDLFEKFVQADYSNSSRVKGSLVTQFNVLDRIARNVWFIANRLFYVLTSIFCLFYYDFFARPFIGKDKKPILDGSANPVAFIYITLIIFVVLFAVEFYLLRKATKLNVEAKKRYEVENIHILERINNLEYIKAASGEDYERERLSKLLDEDFVKNKKSLLWSVLFQAVPSYLIIPNINLLFILLSGAVAAFSVDFQSNPIFSVFNFALIYQTVYSLRMEVEKIISSLVSLDDLSSDLIMVTNTVQVLEKKNRLSIDHLCPFADGDIVFERLVFAYPTRLENVILRNFSFRFVRGQSYGILGKNGVGKSTITKTFLKLYDLQQGNIFINQVNVQKVDTRDLHKHVLYLTNRPSFFQMSIAENIVYPYKYDREKDLPKFEKAAKKVGIDKFIDSLPQRFDTKLKESGSDLSEGQKQQIAMMRLFIYDHYRIFIFDEILSNVNPILKKEILVQAFQKIENKTVIVIDHHYEIFQHVNNVYQFTGEGLVKLEKKQLLE